MRKRKHRMTRPEKPDEADLILRHISRRYPHPVARGLLRTEEPITDVHWGETQVSARQRRLDRALRVHVAGEPLLLHIEWTMRLGRRIPFRVFEYHQLVAFSSHDDARGAEPPHHEPVPIESVVVVLSGPLGSLPEYGQYRTSPRNAKFSGIVYRVEPIYQKTVAELEAMGGGVFWLVFVPLATDVDQEKLERVIERLKRECDERDFADLMAAISAMARLRARDNGIAAMLRSLMPKGLVMNNWIYKEGKAAGLALGRKEGRQEGRQEGVHDALAPLVHLIERRIGRSLTVRERERIALRLDKDGPEKLGDVILDLSPRKLEAWLAPRKPSKPARAA